VEPTPPLLRLSIGLIYQPWMIDGDDCGMIEWHLTLLLCPPQTPHNECRLLGYKNPVRTSQVTHYVSITEHSQ
jgi:hypothetical protein